MLCSSCSSTLAVSTVLRKIVEQKIKQFYLTSGVKKVDLCRAQLLKKFENLQCYCEKFPASMSDIPGMTFRNSAFFPGLHFRLYTTAISLGLLEAIFLQKFKFKKSLTSLETFFDTMKAANTGINTLVSGWFWRFSQKNPAVFGCLTNALAPPPIALESCSMAQTDRPV